MSSSVSINPFLPPIHLPIQTSEVPVISLLMPVMLLKSVGSQNFNACLTFEGLLSKVCLTAQGVRTVVSTMTPSVQSWDLLWPYKTPSCSAGLGEYHKNTSKKRTVSKLRTPPPHQVRRSSHLCRSISWSHQHCTHSHATHSIHTRGMHLHSTNKRLVQIHVTHSHGTHIYSTPTQCTFGTHAMYTHTVHRLTIYIQTCSQYIHRRHGTNKPMVQLRMVHLHRIHLVDVRTGRTYIPNK